MSIPRATARLQFHKDFTLDDGADVVDYLAALGISHLYASPIFKARTGSTHGYDIIDPTCINPELGGEPALKRLVTRLRAAGMGLILDIVPNHMGVGGSENPWWQHVLEWGRQSPYAEWFDIDWNRADPALQGKVLLPFLGDQYGRILDAGELSLRFDPESGKLFVAYHTHRFPISPCHYLAILRSAGEPALDAATTVLERLTDSDPSAAQAQADEAFASLRKAADDPAIFQAIETALARYSPETPDGIQRLHELLDKQHYRLSWWRFAADGINWRRFFEVTELAGIRVERDDVFDTTHGLIFRLYEEGLIDGVRVDHVDGLAYPGGYCRKLRQRLDALQPKRPADVPQGPAYIIVEKILAADETIRPDWPIHGTTGYDFMDQVGAVLHHPAGAPKLNALWTELTGKTANFDAEVQTARRQLITHNLAAEFNAATRAVLAVARSDLATRDYSLNAIRRVYTELLVYFPVYRTYVRDAARGEHDSDVFERAMQKARRQVYPTDLPLLAHLDAWLGGEAPEAIIDPQCRELRDRAIRRFQQLTPPLAAKSVEDTAFYRYGRLLSRNEVGADPGQFAMSGREFHAACVERAKRFPHTMLATATHDHKRGEDVTARIAVLSELPEEWGQCVRRWMVLNSARRTVATLEEGSVPEVMPYAADEIILYQMLVGAWPIGLEAGDAAGIRAFADRLAQWQNKALREAKAMSNWVEPNQAYESACRDFLYAILDNHPDNAFLPELIAWIKRITGAGIINSFAQTVLRLTSPGMPDLYQGTEFWDFSLVDPDNRRPVDFPARREALAASAVMPLEETPWKSGGLKQRIIHACLACRSRLPELFAQGDYLPVTLEGASSGTLLGFLRRYGENTLLVLTARFPAHIGVSGEVPALPSGAWKETNIVLPEDAPAGWVNIFNGERLTAEAGRLPVEGLLKQLPVAVLTGAA